MSPFRGLPIDPPLHPIAQSARRHEKKIPMKRICEFTGSSPGARAEYADAAKSLGELLAERGCTLVYGGAKVGLMGVLADSALAAGGRVVGVIPEGLLAREVAHRKLSELRVVASE
jgi:hypothetical protein